jgi:hypothetical protein
LVDRGGRVRKVVDAWEDVYGARAAAAAREGEDVEGGGEGRGGCRDDPVGFVAADFDRDCSMVDAQVYVNRYRDIYAYVYMCACIYMHEHIDWGTTRLQGVIFSIAVD